MRNPAVCLPLTVGACLALLLPAAPAGADDSISPRPACTIEGTAGNDILRGTAGDDVICGRAGDDIILGLAGNDILRGGPGDDILVGGPGRDALFGGDGADQLVDIQQPGRVNGGPGPDVCVAVAGSTASGCERLIFQPARG